MKIVKIECPTCGLKLNKNKTMYITDARGKRFPCFHPAEGYRIWGILKPELNWLQRKAKDTPFSLFDIFDIKRGLTPLQKLLGFKDVRALIDARSGVFSNMICLDCYETFKLDIRGDEKVCPLCSSNNIAETVDLIGRACPKCKSAVIVERDTGMRT